MEIMNYIINIIVCVGMLIYKYMSTRKKEKASDWDKFAITFFAAAFVATFVKMCLHLFAK